MTDGANPVSVEGLVSVIVASYNHVEFLEHRMESLIGQTYPNIEILVIDDCSNDGSVEFLERYSENPKVSLILNSENLGWVETSNKGASLARGEFVIFANCDDFADLSQIERLVEAVRQNPGISMAFSRSHMVDEEDRILGDDFAGREQGFKEYCISDTVIPRMKMAEFLMHSCVIPNLSAVLVRKDSFLESKGFTAEYRVVSDWDLFFKMSQHGDTFWVSQPLNYFRQHEETIRATTKERIILREIFDLLDGALDKWQFRRRVKHRKKVDIARKWAKHLIRYPFDSIIHGGFHLRMMVSSRFRYAGWLPWATVSVVWEKFKSLARRLTTRSRTQDKDKLGSGRS